MLIVIAGPSGAGKDAVRNKLMAWGFPARFAVTATSRPKRPDELAGKDYYFISDEEFDRMVAEDAFIEHALVYGQKKGVPRREVMEPLSRGEDVIARVDIQGAATLKQMVPDALLIYIAPPSQAEAEKRLAGRETESEEQLKLRLATAAAEAESASRFDYVVVNENHRVVDTARRVMEIVAAEKARRSR